MKFDYMEVLVPSEFYLGQNSPNPFKEMTKIKYCLPSKVNVNLTKINSTGKGSKKLVNKTQKAGTYEIKIDGNELTAGTYEYQLEAFELKTRSRRIFKETKKMILIK